MGTLKVWTFPLPVSVTACQFAAAKSARHSAPYVTPLTPAGCVKLIP